MEHHPSRHDPKAAGSREHLKYDLGGWISGPSLDMPDAAGEPVTAAEVRSGDVLIIGEVRAKVDAVDPVQFIDDGSGEVIGGLAIWWTARNSCGILRRRVHEIVYRATGQAG